MTRLEAAGPAGGNDPAAGPAAVTGDGGRSRTVPVVLVTAGAVLLAVCLLLLTGERQLPTAFGALSPPAATQPTPAPSPVPVPAGPAVADPSTSAPDAAPAAAPQVPGPSALPAPPAADPPPPAQVPGAPLAVNLPDLGVSAPVVELLTEDGVLHPPTDPAVVGWWAASALAGAAQGSTVIAGHVDSADAGLGALAGLSELTAGSRVDVRTDSGTTGYTVTALLVLDKGAGLPADLFTRSGPPRLVLITCGGPFDEETLSYRDNVVVLADPA